MGLTAALTKHLRAADLFAALASVTRPSAQWTGATFDVFNPSTGELLATLPDMGIEEAHAAIEAAAAAQGRWAAKPAKDRSTILRRWHDLIV
ncbi:aldehyde dehydrogenase family protein, partial [Sinorhizobium sp. 6-117]